jgi:hypothetical protein
MALTIKVGTTTQNVTIMKYNFSAEKDLAS